MTRCDYPDGVTHEVAFQASNDVVTMACGMLVLAMDTMPGSPWGITCLACLAELSSGEVWQQWPADVPLRFNGSTEPCDMWTGPCSCGAWHRHGR